MFLYNDKDKRMGTKSKKSNNKMKNYRSIGFMIFTQNIVSGGEAGGAVNIYA
jgi:hypothetical protein